MMNLRSTVSNRSYGDRRGDQDRRQHYDIAMVDKLGYDRRRPYAERRQSSELRTGWVRVSKWSSACVEYLSA